MKQPAITHAFNIIPYKMENHIITPAIKTFSKEGFTKLSTLEEKLSYAVSLKNYLYSIQRSLSFQSHSQRESAKEILNQESKKAFAEMAVLLEKDIEKGLTFKNIDSFLLFTSGLGFWQYLSSEVDFFKIGLEDYLSTNLKEIILKSLNHNFWNEKVAGNELLLEQADFSKGKVKFLLSQLVLALATSPDAKIVQSLNELILNSPPRNIELLSFISLLFFINNGAVKCESSSLLGWELNGNANLNVLKDDIIKTHLFKEPAVFFKILELFLSEVSLRYTLPPKNVIDFLRTGLWNILCKNESLFEELCEEKYRKTLNALIEDFLAHSELHSLEHFYLPSLRVINKYYLPLLQREDVTAFEEMNERLFYGVLYPNDSPYPSLTRLMFDQNYCISIPLFKKVVEFYLERAYTYFAQTDNFLKHEFKSRVANYLEEQKLILTTGIQSSHLNLVENELVAGFVKTMGAILSKMEKVPSSEKASSVLEKIPLKLREYFPNDLNDKIEELTRKSDAPQPLFEHEQDLSAFLNDVVNNIRF